MLLLEMYVFLQNSTFEEKSLTEKCTKWMSEANMTSLATKRIAGVVAYEPTFLEALSPALENIARYRIKVAVNAGGSDTRGLWEAVR